MKIEMTPLKVEILLWYNCTDSNFPRMDAPAVKEAMDEFVQYGIAFKVIDENTSICYTFDREALSMYIEELLRVPLPTKTWSIVR